MGSTRLCMLALRLGLGSAGLTACDSSDGPAEQAGEKVDNATQKAGRRSRTPATNFSARPNKRPTGHTIFGEIR